MGACTYNTHITDHSVPYFQVDTEIICGAARMAEYLPLLEGKKVGLVANHTAFVGNVHLVDTLLALSVGLKKIFSPEHGFRGTFEAGEEYGSYIDTKTGLPIVSLYGKNRKPPSVEMDELDIVLFDIQDVGVRFYTYISTMHYVMEACAEKNIPLIILDRPNPNGFYVDGPVLDTHFRSFVGMHPVPLVHGMTIAEYACMINGENWLSSGKSQLSYVLCAGYDHTKKYKLPINPSPNLTSSRAIYLYPSLGLFEGTVISVARGTAHPFEAFGHPDMMNASFSFTPRNLSNAPIKPPFENKICKGIDLRTIPIDSLLQHPTVSLRWMIFAYNNMPDTKKFFNSFFHKLAGNDQLRKQIENGMNEGEIKKTWQEGLQKFKNIRKKYLLYPDFAQ